MIGKKINQLATELAPVSTDLTIIGDPTTGVSKKITLAQLGAIFSGAVSFYTNLAGFPAVGDINVIYCAKDTQKLYLWSGSAYVEVFPSQALLDTYQLRSEKGNANGYASLDSQGKVPISQLPSSIMEYKGTWNASTNTPTLANGTGDTGDVYICNVAGTVNFGAGPITFAVGDYVIYSGTIWQRSSGAVGTVTSVAVSRSGDALAITGSPVTTSGTINIGFAGNSTQYINGAGNLVTFPGVINEAQNLITEVYNKTGATLTKGTVVYINGGQGNLPAVTKALATGDSTSAQTYGIVRNDITNNNNGYVVVAGRISDLDTQAYTEGTQLYLSSTTAGTYTSTKQYAPNHLVYVGIVVRAHPTQGVIEVKIQNGYEMDELHNVAAQSPSNGDILQYVSATSLWTKVAGTTSNIAEGSNLYYTDARSRAAISETVTGLDYNNTTGVLSLTSGYVIPTTTNETNWNAAYNDKINSAAVTGTTTKTLTLTQQDGGTITASWTDINTDAVTSVFGRTGAVVAASGDYTTAQVTESGNLYFTNARAIASTLTGYTSGAGTITSSDSILSAIQKLNGNIGALTTGVSSVNGLTGAVTLTTSNIAEGTNLYYTEARVNANTNVAANTAARHNAVTIGTANGLSLSTQVLSLALASGSTTGALSSTDWTTFNNKQNALTNPVTGTGTTNYLPKFTGTSTIGNSLVFDDGSGIRIGATSHTLASNRRLTVVGASAIEAVATGTGGEPTIEMWQKHTAGDNVFAYFFTEAAATTRGYLQYDRSGNRLNLVGSGNGLLFTGASTFSNNVTVQSDSAYYRIRRVAGTDVGYITDSTTWGASGTDFTIGASSSNLRFFTNNSVTERMRLDASGNLGLGVTPSAWSGRVAIQISPKLALWGDVNQSIISHNIYTDPSDKYIANGAASIYTQSNGSHIWLNAPSGTAGNAISFTQAMTLDASGRLGIGVTSINGLLSLKANKSNTPILRFQNQDSGPDSAISTYTSSTQTYTLIGHNIYVDSSGNAPRFNTSYPSCGIAFDEGDLRFLTGNSSANATSKLTIASTGAATFSSSVTAVGTMQLAEDGTYGSTYKTLGFTGITNGSHRIFAGTADDLYIAAATSRGISFWTNGSSATRMFISGTGNVGIGTTSPNLLLTVYGSSISNLNLKNASNGVYGFTIEASGVNSELWNYADGYMRFGTNNNERMRITSGGNVEINTGSIKTGEPDTGWGRAAIKIGASVSGVSFNTTRYLPVSVDGTVYYINLNSSTP